MQVPVPTIGRIVIFSSRDGDGVVSPALVLRTRASTVPEVIDRWVSTEDTVSGVDRPDGLVAELPDDFTVDLLVHGLGGDYREYSVPFDPEGKPRTWSWPNRVSNLGTWNA